MDLVVYKAVFGNYDKITVNRSSRFRHILFTDKNIDVDGWETIRVEASDPVVLNRRIKMFPWEYFDAEFSIYLDGRIDVFEAFFDFILGKNLKDKILVPSHRQGGQVIDELVRCINYRRVNAKQLREAMATAALDKPAVECGLIVRDHNCKAIAEHAHRWMSRYQSFGRDQLAFYDNQDIDFIEILNFDLAYEKYFRMRRHKWARTKQIKSRLNYAVDIILSGMALK